MMKKRLVSLLLVLTMVVCMIPAQTIAAETTAVDNSKLPLDSSGYADCPVCDKNVKWTAVSGERSADYWLQSGGHYYLSDNMTYTGSYAAIYINSASENPACFHLNGYNITASNKGYVIAFNGENKTANFMGTGTVTGTKTGDGYACATANVLGNGNVLNLYGGTYTKQSSNNPVVFVWSGTVNLYEGAQLVDPSDTASPTSGTVTLWNEGAAFHLRGGSISGGKAKNSGGNVHINNGSFTMHSGSISGGTAAAYHGGNVYLKAGSFTMLGGTISDGTATYYGDNVYLSGGTAVLSGGNIENGNVQVAASGIATLSGAPVIEELKLPENVTVAVDGVTSGADVAVNASGVFTAAGTANLGGFRAYNGTDSILAGADGALRYVSNAKLSFAEGTTNAYCPVCAKTVSWTALSGTRTSSVWLNNAGSHYYLENDLSSSAGDGVFAVNVSAGSTVCLHLNGHNITSTVDSVVRYYKDGTMNVMGNGTVSGSGVVAATKWRAATLNVTNGGTLNLYGGTYTKGASDAPVIWVWAGEVNLYSSTKVVGTDQNLSTYSGAVILQKAEASFNMYGGEISGGHNTNSGGNVNIVDGAFTISGGTISGGNAAGYYGGNVYLKAGSFTMSGGVISDGNAAYNGDNVYLSGGTAVLSGGKIENGNVQVAASGIATLSGVPQIDNLAVPADVTVKVGTLTQGAQISIFDDCAVSTEADLQAYVDAGYFITPLEDKVVAVQNGKLVIVDAPVEEPPQEPEDNGPTYILGDVLYETDFDNDTVGSLPAGWSAGYSEGSAEDGTLTSFGWGSGGSLTAQVEAFGDYGNAYHFGSTNNDAFTAMPAISTMNYLYEAEVYVERGGSIGLANNFYAPTDEANGALFSSIYLNGDPAKYTYKGVGAANGVLWDTSYTPAKNEVVKLQILSLNGKNYIMYDNRIVAICNSRTGAENVDHPGFYACYGGVYVLNVKVTEVFAADLQLSAARITVAADKTAKLELEMDFDKRQGIYQQVGDALKFGFVIFVGDEDISSGLVRETENAVMVDLSGSALQKDNNTLRFETVLDVHALEYQKWFSVRPFAVVDDICFYGEGAAYQPANLANGAYLSAQSASVKELILEMFGNCPQLTVGKTAKQLTFTLFSDFHYIAGMYPATISDLNTILQRADDSNSSFILSAGDFTNDMKGSPELYNTYRNYVTKEGKILPAYNVYGNHELEFGNAMTDVTWTLTNDEYTDHTVVWGSADGSYDASVGYYYFESDGFRIIGLDSEHSFNPTTGQWEHNRTGSSGAPSGNLYPGSLGPVQLAWLETVLMDAASKDIPCIVVAHDGFTGLGWADTSPDSEAVRAIYAKANAANPGTVLMSINGHIHTDHQGWNDGVFYFDTNTVRNAWWQETAVAHYTDEHTFMFEEYDDEGNLIATYEKPYNTLTMGSKTWFSQDPLSCVITISDAGVVCVDGAKSQWAYGIVPTAASTVDGVKCEITSGTFWDCNRDGHIEQPVITQTQHYTICTNAQCDYESVYKSHCGMLLQLPDGTVSFPADSASAVAESMANNGSFIKLLADGTVFTLSANQTVCIDMNGKKTTISGSGTLRGMDSANDDYKSSAGAAIVSDTVTVEKDVTENGKRYIAITENGSTTFHRLEMRISAISLRTTACGIYYKAKFSCDSVLAKRVSTYGTVLSVDNVPGADFLTEKDEINGYTVKTPEADFGSGTVATSGAVFNIMKTDTAEFNAQRGAIPIYANGYIVVDGQTLVADTENVNRKVTDEGFTGVAFSLLDVLKDIDANWDNYVHNGQADKVKAFYNTWAQYGMNAWSDQLTNIAA